jgi:hypothetical protein
MLNPKLNCVQEIDKKKLFTTLLLNPKLQTQSCAKKLIKKWLEA